MIVEWKPSFCCGVESIDEQHKALVALIVNLQRAMAEGRARQEVDETIENLVFYVRYHFAWEEQWYDQHGFKGLAAHTAEHELLTRDVIQLQTRLQEGKLVAAVPLMRLLQGWLLTHIDGSDKAAVAAVLRAQDAAAPNQRQRAFENVAD
jgi:hemerythrin-like metal-binding protein